MYIQRFNSGTLHYEVEHADIDGLLEKTTDEDDVLKLVVFANSDTISLLVMAADYNVINAEGIDVIHGLIVLLGTYYCTDQEYPRCYSQFLGISQTIGLTEEFK